MRLKIYLNHLADDYLTIVRGYGFSINEKEFDAYLDEQKNRSRAATQVNTDDWVYTSLQWNTDRGRKIKFLGYEEIDAEYYITRYKNIYRY